MRCNCEGAFLHCFCEIPDVKPMPSVTLRDGRAIVHTPSLSKWEAGRLAEKLLYFSKYGELPEEDDE